MANILRPSAQDKLEDNESNSQYYSAADSKHLNPKTEVVAGSRHESNDVNIASVQVQTTSGDCEVCNIMLIVIFWLEFSNISCRRKKKGFASLI